MAGYLYQGQGVLCRTRPWRCDRARYTLLITFEVTAKKRPRREPHEMPMTVGERIRRRRSELGLTQDGLAQKAVISKSFLSDVENGKRSIGAETLLDLGHSMEVSLDYLMTGEVSEDRP